MTTSQRRRGRVVVVDYPGRREEGRVSDLGLPEAGFDVIDVLAPDASPVTDPDDYPRVLRERAGPSAGTTAVLGYCLAAPLALSLARALNIPLVMLFEAADITAEVIATEYTAIGSPGSEPESVLIGRWSAAELATGTEVLTRMRTALGTVLGAVLGEDGGEREGAEILLAAYLDWLTFLVAGHRAGLADGQGPAVVNIVSRSGAGGSTGKRGPDVETVAFDCDRNALLHQPGVREFVVNRLVARSGGTR